MPPTPLSEAVLICTRNRPSDLRSTLESIAAQQEAEERHLLVIDASDAAGQAKNRDALTQLDPGPWHHHSYDKRPSLTRQRNHGISLLPSLVDVVHFLDDDVTVHPRYFRALTHALHENRGLGGVGGIVYEKGCSSPPKSSPRLKRLFLLDGPPGQMLPSGHAPSAQRYPPSHPTPSSPVPTSFLNGCSATFRHDVLTKSTFDPHLEAHSLFEDLDLSYRVSRSHELRVIPEAALTHHRSPRNRQSIAQYAREMVVHRYWLVCKHDLSKVAFWWSVFGQFGARLLSTQANKWTSLSGLIQGIAGILRRDSKRLPSLE